MLLKYDKLIVGASFTGIGIASQDPDSIIVESSICTGAEFINALNPGTGWDIKLHSNDAMEFFDKIKKHNVFENGKIHLPALAPIMCDWMIVKTIKIKMATEIIKIKTSGSGFEITIFDTEGEHKLFAAQIVDTTEGICSARLNKTKLPVIKKTLNAMLHSDCGHIQSGEYGGIEVRSGRFQSEAVAMFSVPPDCCWPDARQILHSSWKSRPQSLREWKIAAVATRFNYMTTLGLSRIKKNWLHLPSSSFKNPVAAYDNGYTIDLREEK